MTMQIRILLLSSTLILVTGQVPTYQCPPDPPVSTTAAPNPPTYNCPNDTTTSAPPTTYVYPTYSCPNDTTTTAPPTTYVYPTYNCPNDTTTSAPPTTYVYPTYSCPNDTTTSAPPTTYVYPTYSCPNDTTTSAPPTTSSPPSDSCVYPAACDASVVVNLDGFIPEFSPFYDQIITSGGDHLEYDSECSTIFPCGDKTYIFFRSVVFKDNTYEVKRFIYAPVHNTPGVYRAQGINGNDGCDTCVFNDYYLGQPCNGTWVLKRCYIYGDCKDEYKDTTYIVFSTTPYISNECYGPIQDIIGTNYTTVPRKYNRRCITSIGGLRAINADSVASADSVAID